MSTPKDLTTLWVRTEGVDMFPLLCARHIDVAWASQMLEDARIVLPDSDWNAPCCLSTHDLGCIRDAFCDPDTLHVTRVIREAATRAGFELPEDVSCN